MNRVTPCAVHLLPFNPGSMMAMNPFGLSAVRLIEATSIEGAGGVWALSSPMELTPRVPARARRANAIRVLRVVCVGYMASLHHAWTRAGPARLGCCPVTCRHPAILTELKLGAAGSVRPAILT